MSGKTSYGDKQLEDIMKNPAYGLVYRGKAKKVPSTLVSRRRIAAETQARRHATWKPMKSSRTSRREERKRKAAARRQRWVLEGLPPGVSESTAQYIQGMLGGAKIGSVVPVPSHKAMAKQPTSPAMSSASSGRLRSTASTASMPSSSASSADGSDADAGSALADGLEFMSIGRSSMRDQSGSVSDFSGPSDTESAGSSSPVGREHPHSRGIIEHQVPTGAVAAAAISTSVAAAAAATVASYAPTKNGMRDRAAPMAQRRHVAAPASRSSRVRKNREGADNSRRRQQAEKEAMQAEIADLRTQLAASKATSAQLEIRNGALAAHVHTLSQLLQRAIGSSAAGGVCGPGTTAAAFHAMQAADSSIDSESFSAARVPVAAVPGQKRRRNSDAGRRELANDMLAAAAQAGLGYGSMAGSSSQRAMDDGSDCALSTAPLRIRAPSDSSLASSLPHPSDALAADDKAKLQAGASGWSVPGSPSSSIVAAAMVRAESSSSTSNSTGSRFCTGLSPISDLPLAHGAASPAPFCGRDDSANSPTLGGTGSESPSWMRFGSDEAPGHGHGAGSTDSVAVAGSVSTMRPWEPAWLGSRGNDCTASFEPTQAGGQLGCSGASDAGLDGAGSVPAGSPSAAMSPTGSVMQGAEQMLHEDVRGAGGAEEGYTVAKRSEAAGGDEEPRAPKRRRIAGGVGVASHHLGLVLACVACCLSVLHGPQQMGLASLAGGAGGAPAPAFRPSAKGVASGGQGRPGAGDFRLLSVEVNAEADGVDLGPQFVSEAGLYSRHPSLVDRSGAGGAPVVEWQWPGLMQAHGLTWSFHPVAAVERIVGSSIVGDGAVGQGWGQHASGGVSSAETWYVVRLAAALMAVVICFGEVCEGACKDVCRGAIGAWGLARRACVVCQGACAELCGCEHGSGASPSRGARRRRLPSF